MAQVSGEWNEGKPQRYEADTHYDVRFPDGAIRHVIGTAKDGPRYMDNRFAHEETRIDQGKVVAWRLR